MVVPRGQHRLARFIAEIEANGEEARFWAEHCGWIPGTGYCRIGGSAECRGLCTFAAMRAAERERISRLRQRRRQRQPDPD